MCNVTVFKKMLLIRKESNRATNAKDTFLKIMLLCSLFLGAQLSSYAADEKWAITPDLEMHIIENVGGTETTVSYVNSYSSAPVVVCTFNLPDSSNREAVVRINNVTASSYKVRIQHPPNVIPTYSANVYCTISKIGKFTSPIKYEAGVVTVDDISRQGRWRTSDGNNQEKITQEQNYTNPVVVGQVMTSNDPIFSVFWSNQCGSRNVAATNNEICVGRHTSKHRNNSPVSEDVSYIIAEQGDYILSTGKVKIARGGDTIRGVKDSPPYNYSLGEQYQFAAASQAAEDGGDGGWAVLYGNAPVTTNLALAIDEYDVGLYDNNPNTNSDRKHTTEEVDYWVMQPIDRNYADLIINEIMYNHQLDDSREFVELYATTSGSIYNYVLSQQDGTAQTYRLPDINVNAGDYIVFYYGTGTDSSYTNSEGNTVHEVYAGSNSSVLANGGDDVILLKPSNTDTTVLAEGSAAEETLVGFPVDYVAYGGATSASVDASPISLGGVTANWNYSFGAELLGASQGASISLSPNSADSDSSACWELTASDNANDNNCPNYFPTRDIPLGDAYIHSRGESNNEGPPKLKLQKTVAVISDPINGTTNPKAVQGSVLEYTITAQNLGQGRADSGSVVVHDTIASDLKLCVPVSPAVPECEAPSIDVSTSGLTSGTVAYSQNAGADNYTYSPVADSDGADTNVNKIRVSTQGAFLGDSSGGTSPPEFTVKFRVIKK